jgi:hypothetical protein
MTAVLAVDISRLKPAISWKRSARSLRSGTQAGDGGAAFFLQAFACGIPQRQAHALAPVGGGAVDGPDLTGGGAGLFVAGAVETDKAHDLVTIHGHLDLGLGIFNGFAPVGLALFDGEGLQLLVGHQSFEGGLCGYGVDLGDGFGIAECGGTNLDTGHEKPTGNKLSKNETERHCRRK